MNRIVSLSVAGFGALTTLAFAGSQDRASTSAVSTVGSTKPTSLTRVTSEPAVAIVSTPGCPTVVARCISIQSTNGSACSAGGQVSTVVVRGTSPESRVVMQTSPGGTVQFRTNDGGATGLTVIRSDGSVAAGTCTSSSASSSQGACASSGAVARGGAVSVASSGSGQSLDLRELLNKAGVAHGQTVVVEGGCDAQAMQPELAGQGNAGIFDRILVERLANHDDDADEVDEPEEVDEPDEVGADDMDMESAVFEDVEMQNFAFPDEGQMRASIEDALASARDSIVTHQQDLEVMLERSRESMRRAQERARQSMDESRVRYREAQEAARASAQRHDEAAREAHNRALRYHEANSGAAAVNVDRALEARIEALERAARERGQSIDSGDRSLEERVAQLERAMNTRNPAPARVLDVAPNSDVDVIEVRPDGTAGPARRSIRSRAGASAPSAGGTVRTHVWVAPSATAPFDRATPVNPSTLAPFESMSPLAPVAPVAPVAPSAPDDVAPRAGLHFVSPPSAAAAPSAPRHVRGLGNSARASSPNAQERAELERALDDLRSEAGRLREQMERMRAEIDRLPQQNR